MDHAAVGPKATTGAELKAEQDAERAGEPFLVHRDARGTHRIVVLGEGGRPLWIGRSASLDVSFS